MLILFLIIAIGILVTVIIRLEKQRTKNNTDDKYPIHTIALDEKVSLKTNEEIEPHHKRMDHLHKKHINRTRKTHVWAELRFIKSIENIIDSENFYDLDKSLGDFHDAKARLFEKHYRPTNEEIDIAIRFCTIGYTQERCSHQLTSSEMHDIHYWESYYIHESTITNVATSFKDYWDNVLASYKSSSAKKKRIDYLVNHLNEMKEKESLQEFPNVKDHISQLISYYKSMQ